MIFISTYLAYEKFKKHEKITQYKVKIKFASGIKTKLVLNEEQYQQFDTWLKDEYERAYEITDGKHKVAIKRHYIACVEVEKK